MRLRDSSCKRLFNYYLLSWWKWWVKLISEDKTQLVMNISCGGRKFWVYRRSAVFSLLTCCFHIDISVEFLHQPVSILFSLLSLSPSYYFTSATWCYAVTRKCNKRYSWNPWQSLLQIKPEKYNPQSFSDCSMR